MSKRRVTASGVDLAMLCGWSFRPDAIVAPQDEDRWLHNTAIHSAIEFTIRTRSDLCVIDPKVEERLTDAKVKEVRQKHRAWLTDWWDEQKGEEWTPEVAMAFNPETGERMRLNPKHHRDYSEAPEGWVPGSADAIRPEAGSTMHVLDWKTGSSRPVAAHNGQLATLALGTGADHVIAGIAHVTEDGVRVDWTEFDHFDLLDWRDRLRSTVANIAKAEPVMGPHCRDKFCPSYGLCPATSRSLERVAPDVRRLPIITTNPIEIENAAHAAQIYGAIREAEAAFKARVSLVKEALKAYSDMVGGIPLPGGKVYRLNESSQERIDVLDEAAAAAIRAEIGEDAWREAVTFETNKAAIKRAARAVKEKTGEPLAAIERRVIAALRAAGAVRVVRNKRHEEVTDRGDEENAA